MATDESLPVTMRGHILRFIEESGIAAIVPAELLEAGMQDIELGAGQLLADVERASRRGVSLADAVHAHEQYPYLGRFHGILHDALLAELPAELMPIMQRLLAMEAPAWPQHLLDDLCVIARSSQASPQERALARLVVFEELRIKLFLATYRTDGGFEGLGGSRRDLDELADEQLRNLLAIPLAVDAATQFRPFITTMAAAMERLQQHIDRLWAGHALIEELRQACEDRAQLERLLRYADPVDAVILQNKFARADHQQPIPLKRLPLEHPLILSGHNEDSLNQRCSRAVRALSENPKRLARRPRSINLIELVLEMESANA